MRNKQPAEYIRDALEIVLSGVAIAIAIAIAIAVVAGPPARAQPFNTATNPTCRFAVSARQPVARVIDARTLELSDTTRLRLPAILPPDGADSPIAGAVATEIVAATKLTTDMTRARTVIVSENPSARDRYGRRLGRAFIAATSASVPSVENWLEARIVAAGMARVVLVPELDVHCARDLLALEADAQRAGRGLWANRIYAPRRAGGTRELHRLRSTYQIIEGVVRRVSVRRATVYLNFGDDWRRDFTAKITGHATKEAGVSPKSFRALKRRGVRLRGWLEKRNGPLMTIWRLDQIEQLSVTDAGTWRRGDPPNLLGPSALRSAAGHNQTDSTPVVPAR